MKLLEQNLFGGSAVRLTVNATALGSLAAEALPKRKTETQVALWSFPFEVRRRRLVKDEAVMKALSDELRVMDVVVEEKRIVRGLSSGRKNYSTFIRRPAARISGRVERAGRSEESLPACSAK